MTALRNRAHCMTQAPLDGDRLLSARTLCQLLDTTDRTFRRWVSAGKFPRADIKVGRASRWKESTLKTWIDSYDI